MCEQNKGNFLKFHSCEQNKGNFLNEKKIEGQKKVGGEKNWGVKKKLGVNHLGGHFICANKNFTTSLIFTIYLGFPLFSFVRTNRQFHLCNLFKISLIFICANKQTISFVRTNRQTNGQTNKQTTKIYLV